MKIKTIATNVYGEKSTFEVVQCDHTDIPDVKEAYNAWRMQKYKAKKLHGRAPNIPEYITETCLCLAKNYVRFYKAIKLKNGSFDCFDILYEKANQVKACSVADDLTSFGPKSKWDKLYFLDFYNDGVDDGTFDIYEIPDDLIYNCFVKKGRTFKEAQDLGLRPRISIKTKIILPFGIEPVEKGIKLW